jgi:hypothetical protein
LVRDATDDAVERPQTTPQPKKLQLRKSQLTRRTKLRKIKSQLLATDGAAEHAIQAPEIG